MSKLYAALVLCAVTISTQAQETRYVSDVLTITVRSGKGTQHRIVRTLESGTPVEVLETDPEGYTRIRMPGGLEGWALTRYLLRQPIARDRLAEVEQRMGELTSSNRQLRDQNALLEEENRSAREDIAALREANGAAARELDELRDFAARPKAIEAENEKLKDKVGNLESEALLLRQRNNTLKTNAERDFLIAGAAVLGLGFVLGIVIPRIRWKKRSSWKNF